MTYDKKWESSQEDINYFTSIILIEYMLVLNNIKDVGKLNIIPALYSRFPDNMNQGPRISASFALAGNSFFFLFSLPAISTFLMTDQIYGTLALMLKNFRFKSVFFFTGFISSIQANQNKYPNPPYCD